MILTRDPTLALVCGLLPLAIGERSARRFYGGDANHSTTATLDRVLDHLRADECRLLRRRLCFDFIRSLDLHLSVAGFQRPARTTLRREPRTRDLALPGDLFSAP